MQMSDNVYKTLFVIFIDEAINVVKTIAICVITKS